MLIQSYISLWLKIGGGMKSSDSNTNVVVVNNNDISAQQKEDLLDALRLSQSNVVNDNQ